jgi:hypothetical protein
MGVTAHVLFHFIDGRMIMADTFEFKNLVGTAKGMTAILDNKECDDNSIEVPGVDWFTYANNPVTTIYVNGNNYVGFGVDDEQLKICNDDGEIYYVYRQDGTLNIGEKFLKIRVEGFTDYDSDYQDDRSALKYELFILNNQTIKLFLLQLPSNSNYLYRLRKLHLFYVLQLIRYLLQSMAAVRKYIHQQSFLQVALFL